MDKYFYIDKQGNQQGPCDIATLKSKGIAPSTKIWKRGMSTYTEALIVLPQLFNTNDTGKLKVYTESSQHKDNIDSATSQNPSIPKLHYDKDGNLHIKSPGSSDKDIFFDTNGKCHYYNPKDNKKEEDNHNNSKEKNINKQNEGKETKNPEPPVTKHRKEYEEELKRWKIFAITQLICTFTIFLFLAILFEIKASETMEMKADFMNTIEKGHYSGRANIVLVIYWIAWFGAKYWPLFAIAAAGIASLFSISQKKLEDIQSSTLISLGICIGTVILGIISIFYPFAIFIILIAGLAIGLICSWVSSWWNDNK